MWVLKLLGALIVRRIFIYSIIFLAIAYFPASHSLKNFDLSDNFQRTISPVEWVLGNFDGTYYLGIAQRGYFNGEQAFFPLYPILIRLMQDWTNIPFVFSAHIVSFLGQFFALIVLVLLLRQDGYKSFTRTAIVLILLYPTSFYYGAIYNDSTFFFFANLCILLSRKGKFFVASVIGGLATLTRLDGLALFFIISLEYFTQANTLKSISAQWYLKELIAGLSRALSPKRIYLSRVYAVLLVPLSFVGYLYYINTKFGSWTTVFTSMKAWGQDKVTFPLQVFWRYINIVFFHPEIKMSYFVAVNEFAAVMLYIFLLFYSYKKIRLSYWVFFAVSILIPSLTGTFQGMPRYGLHLYPFFLSLALWVSTFPRWFKITCICLSIIYLAVLLSFFTRGYFIA